MPVTGHEWSIQDFCQRYVYRIVGGEVVPQGPNAGQKQGVRMPLQIQLGENL